MFCSKCGTKLNDDAKFCAGCGAAQAVQSQPVQQPYIEQSRYPQQQGTFVVVKRKPKGVIIAAIALLVVAATVFSLIFFSDENTCKRVINDAYTQTAKGNYKNGYKKFFTPAVYEKVDSDIRKNYDGGWEEFEKEVKREIAEKEKKISWKIGKVKFYYPSDDTFKDIVNAYANQFDDTEGSKKVTKVAVVAVSETVKIKYDAANDKISTNTYKSDVYLMKIDGKWYVMPQGENKY